MARKRSKESAPVAAEVVVEPAPVETEERTAPQPEYIPRECIYGLLLNDKVKYEAGKPPEIVGNWYIEFVETNSVNTAYGPYQMFDSNGQPLVGYVALDMLKNVARRMWQDNLGNYAATPFPLMSTGNKIMSCMVFA